LKVHPKIRRGNTAEMFSNCW